MFEKLNGSDRPVAVVGMSLRVPGASNLDRFWQKLVSGRDCLTRLSEAEMLEAGVSWQRLVDPRYVRARPILRDIDLFDAAFFDISPFEAERIDPAHRMFLECSWECFEAAGIAPGPDEPTTGVFAGVEGWYREKCLTEIDDPDDPGIGIPLRLGTALDFFAARVSHKLNLGGPSFTIMAACATSLQAIHQAVLSIRTGECGLAIAGGATVDPMQHPEYLSGVEGMLSATGRIRPFDAHADGTIFGYGVGAVLLRPLEDAIASGNPIHAVIRGSSTSNDGNPPGKKSFVAPSPTGQIPAIAGALEDGQIDPDTIGYVEAHGTGTLLGDPTEVRSLTEVYRRHTSRTGYCSIGSVKANVGHLRAAAGVVSFIKSCLALRNRVLPPLTNFSTPNPLIDFESTPFRIHTVAKPWESSDRPRRAAVSSFGFGGSNAHVILEETPQVQTRTSSKRIHLLPVSARSAAALDRRLIDLERHLSAHKDLDLDDFAHTLQCGRTGFSHRVCLTADPEEFDSAHVRSVESHERNV